MTYDANLFHKELTRVLSTLKPDQVDNLNTLFEEDFESTEQAIMEEIEEDPVEETASEETASEETAADETAAEETASEETAADEVASEEIASEETAADETAADETAAEETVADETAADETASEETASNEVLGHKLYKEAISLEQEMSTAEFETLNTLFAEDLMDETIDNQSTIAEFKLRKVAWIQDQNKRARKRWIASTGEASVWSMLVELYKRVPFLKDLDSLDPDKQNKYKDVNLNFITKEAGEGEEDLLIVKGDVECEVTVVHASDDAMFLAPDLRDSVRKVIAGSLGSKLGKECMELLSKATGFSGKAIKDEKRFVGFNPYFNKAESTIEWSAHRNKPIYSIRFTQKDHDIDQHEKYFESLKDFQKAMADSPEAEAPKLELKGEVVVMTGKPPKGYKKVDVAKVLKEKHQVKGIDSRFTKKTTIIIYNEKQTETQKLKLALKAGLKVLTYDQLQLPK